MLTPDKIKSKEFQTTGRGSYRAEDVDAFLQEVYASYEQAFKENGEIIKKMSILANKVEEYKKDEDSLRQALLTAQKLADKIVSDAKESVEQELADSKAEAVKLVAEAKAEAEKIVAEAKTTALATVHDAKKEADDIIGGVNRKVTQETLVFEMLQKEVSAFKQKMMDMYKEHLTLLDRLPSMAEETENISEPAEEIDETPVVEEPVAVADEEPEVTDEPVVAEDDDDGFELTDIDSIEDDTADVLEFEEETEVSEDDEDKFVVDESLLKDEDAFEDISSGDDEEEPVSDGFSLDMSDINFDETEEDELVIGASAVEYAPVDDKTSDESDDDDDDDGAVSFKSFFHKK